MNVHNPLAVEPLPLQGISLVDRINVFFHYRRYFKMIARRWFLLVITVALSLGYSAYQAYTSPNIYQATAVIGVSPKFVTSFSNQAQYLEELTYFYDSQVKYMESREVMKRVEQKLREGDTPVTFPAVLRPKVIKNKGSFTMSVDSTDLEFAKMYVKTWATVFIAKKGEMRDTTLAKSVQATRKDIQSYTEKLQQVRDELAEFKDKNHVASANEAGLGLQSHLSDLEEKLRSKISERKTLEGRTTLELANSLSVPGQNAPEKTGTAPGPKGSIDIKFGGQSQYPDLALRRKTLDAQKSEFVKTLKPEHPAMVDLNQKIELVQSQIQNQLDLLEEQRKAQIETCKKDEESLSKEVDELGKKVRDAAQLQNEFAKLTDREENIKKELESLNKTLSTYNLTPADESQFTKLDPGDGSPIPIAPQRKRMLLLGLMIGLAVGVGIIYFLDRLDDRLELAEDIEAKLKHPVLGQVPQVNLPGTQGNALLLTKLDEHNVFSESIRGVRSAVLLGSQPNTNAVLLVTSAVPGDGKTTFTVNFAITLAIAGHRVLLVDADMRRGNTHSFFGNNRSPGFSEILLGELHWTDVLRQTEIETLKVIHSGKLPSNPGELLISPVTRELIEETKKEFDYIVFDCPPLTAIDDTFSLVNLATGLLFVVRSGQTSMRFAKNALTALTQRGAKVLGLVVNGITPDNPYYYYQHYYHGYYTRGQGDPTPIAATPMPASKMAAPKRGPSRSRNVEAEPDLSDGPSIPTAQEIALMEKAKAEEFKSKRMTAKKADESRPSTGGGPV